MKKITLLSIILFCMMFLTSVTGVGQGTIQIGSGTSTITGAAALPVSNYVYNYNQQIVTADEYAAGGGVAGDITTIRYYPTNVGTTTVWDQWTLYIGNTTKTTFASTTDWVPLAELTQVFSGTITAVANEWFEVTFTAPFNYTGGNIVVAVHEYAPGWTSPPTFRSYTSAANSGIYYRNDSTNPNPATPPTATGRVGNLPQIQFEGALATCLPPTALTASNITTNSAELGWTEGGTSTNWDIEWGTDGFAPTGTPNVNDTGDNPYELTGLDASTSYDFYVRADCGADDTDVSAWVGPFSFTTECDVFSLPFEEEFSSGVLPNCWTNTSSNTVPNGLWKFTGNPDYDQGNTRPVGTFAWVDGSDPSSISDVTLITPTIDISSLTTPYVEFDYFSNNTNEYPNNIFTVDVYDGVSWTTIYTNNTSSSEWRTIGIPLGSFTGSTLQIRFVVDKTAAPSGFAFYNDIVLDNVSVIESPSCLAPTDLTATNFTTTSADLGWTENGSSNNWDIEWGIDGFTPTGTPNVNDTGDNPYNLAGLSEGTDYDFYVRSDCGADDTDVSTWAGPFGFTTAFTAPDCATTPFPADGAMDVPVGDITFTWTAPASGPTPTSYNVYAYDDASGANPTLIVNVATPSADLTINAFDTEIFWAAVPVNGTEEAVGCAIWSFTTATFPGYCLNTAYTSPYPAATYTPAVCDGTTPNVVTTLAFASEYANIAVTAGQTYQFTSSELDLITISYDGAAVSASGVTPLTWTATTDGTVRFYAHLDDDNCGSEGEFRTKSVLCGATLGVDSFDAASLKVYPNPVKDVLNLSYTSEISFVTVYNMLGQEVLSKTVNANGESLNMSELNSGAYFVKVTINDATETIRVIKQ